ncbi:uncharacterized protein [Haliotis cracherodii]|uniref:uncharacterized protein n=1 Tax=Haliotis cracherodii TaxID=6455 RepID=UPI0039E9343A
MRQRPTAVSQAQELRTSEGDEVVQVIPTLYKVDTVLYKSRTKVRPPLPTIRSGINLPDNYKQTTTGDRFLLHSEDNNKLMIFSTANNLRHLAAAETYFCDGTFSMCPNLFYQIYTIHAFVHGKMFPLVYALLPAKKQTTYIRLFQIIKEKAQLLNMRLQPKAIFMDFEVAAQNAARISFQCQLKGCMFHFRKAVWKGAQRYGLQTSFHNNPDVKQFVRRAAALPLIKMCDIVDFWLNALEDFGMDMPGISAFADYVTEFWVEGGYRLMWNHFCTTGPRTTNHVGGWHSKLNNTAASHPNMFKWINIIK